MITAGTATDPHGGRVFEGGAPLARARLAVVMLHGRGGSAEDMLGLAEHMAIPDIAYLAPEAAGHSWWPQSFLAPLAANEPGLSSSLGAVARLMEHLEREGFSRERVVVLGFSQGACLALEHVARGGQPLHAVIAMSGGLLGTGERDSPPRDDLYGHAPKRFDYAGRLDGTIAFLGCHERDPHIPLARVRETQAVLERLGAEVIAQIYPGAGHGIIEEEISFVRGLLNRIRSRPQKHGSQSHDPDCRSNVFGEDRQY
jgi:phospholipase/carboxylesterase